MNIKIAETILRAIDLTNESLIDLFLAPDIRMFL